MSSHGFRPRTLYCLTILVLASLSCVALCKNIKVRLALEGIPEKSFKTILEDSRLDEAPAQDESPRCWPFSKQTAVFFIANTLLPSEHENIAVVKEFAELLRKVYTTSCQKTSIEVKQERIRRFLDVAIGLKQFVVVWSIIGDRPDWDFVQTYLLRLPDASSSSTGSLPRLHSLSFPVKCDEYLVKRYKAELCRWIVQEILARATEIDDGCAFILKKYSQPIQRLSEELELQQQMNSELTLREKVERSRTNQQNAARSIPPPHQGKRFGESDSFRPSNDLEIGDWSVSFPHHRGFGGGGAF